MTTQQLTLTKRDDAYVLDGIDSPSASLELNRGLRSGRITTAGGSLSIEADGPRRRGFVVGGDSPVLRLHSDGSFLPGDHGSARWSMGRGGHRATLATDSGEMEFSVPRFKRKTVEVTVRGEWADLELVALAGCFAVLSNRRGHTYQTMAVVGAINGGR